MAFLEVMIPAFAALASEPNLVEKLKRGYSRRQDLVAESYRFD
jgi:hypothetical protein